MTRAARVPQVEGHALRADGAAFMQLRSGGGWIRSKLSNAGGHGNAVCQCGASSFEYTQGERKAWHRGHREEIIRAESEAS